MNNDYKENEPEEKKKAVREKFNTTARLYGAASGLSGGILVGLLSVAMYTHQGSNWWLAGAIAGLTAAVGSVVDMIKMSNDELKKKDDKPPSGAPDDKNNKPDLKP